MKILTQDYFPIWRCQWGGNIFTHVKYSILPLFWWSRWVFQWVVFYPMVGTFLLQIFKVVCGVSWERFVNKYVLGEEHVWIFLHKFQSKLTGFFLQNKLPKNKKVIPNSTKSSNHYSISCCFTLPTGDNGWYECKGLSLPLCLYFYKLCPFLYSYFCGIVLYKPRNREHQKICGILLSGRYH